jgi:hypothetical protein
VSNFLNRNEAFLKVMRIPAIPTEVGGGNHTAAFTQSARSPEAHKACLDVSKALAACGVRVLTDDNFFANVSH